MVKKRVPASKYIVVVAIFFAFFPLGSLSAQIDVSGETTAVFGSQFWLGYSLYDSSQVKKIVETPLDQADQESQNYPLIIETDPVGIPFLVNQIRYEKTPLKLTEFQVGRNYLELENPYRPLDYSIVLRKGYTYRIKVKAELQLARLSLTSNVNAASFRLDGDQSDRRESTVTAGFHTVSAVAFGYKPWTGSQYFSEGIDYSLNVNFQKAPFEVVDKGPSRASFRPQNYGVLGSSSLQFWVSAPGTGHVTISNTSGDVVQSADIGPFDTWEQEWTFNGRDSQGKYLPDGEYHYTVSFSSPEQNIALEKSGVVSVDSTKVILPRAMAFGDASAATASDPLVLPNGAFQVSIPWTDQFTPSSGSSVQVLGIAARLGLPAGLEMAIAGLARLDDMQAQPFLNVIAGIKWAAIPYASQNPFSLAVRLQGSIGLPVSTYLPAYYAGFDLAFKPGFTLGVSGRVGDFGHAAVLDASMQLGPWPDWNADARVAIAGILEDSVVSLRIGAATGVDSLLSAPRAFRNIEALAELSLLSPFGFGASIRAGSIFSTVGDPVQIIVGVEIFLIN